eukprot:93587-Prymnesium_polylepis.2
MPHRANGVIEYCSERKAMLTRSATRTRDCSYSVPMSKTQPSSSRQADMGMSLDSANAPSRASRMGGMVPGYDDSPVSVSLRHISSGSQQNMLVL